MTNGWKGAFFVASVVVVLCVTSDAKAFTNDFGLYENDWSVVSDGGTAGGMTNCTARKYCTSCETTLSNQSVCIKAYRDAYCKCEYFYQGGVKLCISSGACLYRPL